MPKQISVDSFKIFYLFIPERLDLGLDQCRLEERVDLGDTGG